MTNNRRRQQGNILVPVMLIGLTCTLILGALINHSVYLEQAAVENRLAETRAYWAAMGHFRYAVSRQRYAGFCPASGACLLGLNTIDDATKVTVLQSYLDEIGGLRTFTYPEENSGYSITIDLAAAADDDPSRHAYSGHMMLTSAFPTAGASTLPVLSGAPLRFPPLQLRFCTSLTGAFANCGGVGSNNNNGRPTGNYSIKLFHRMPSVS